MEERIDVVVNSEPAKRGIDALAASFLGLRNATAVAESATTRLFDAMSIGLRKFESSVLSLRSVILGLGSVIGVFKNITDEITRFQAFISAMSVSAGGVAGARQEFSFLMRIADDLGISINALSHNYSQMAAAAANSGISVTQLRNIFESFSIASRVMHLSTQDTRLMFYALTQMVSKGVVSMEELRRQLGEKLPGAMNIAAKSLNTTVQELEKAIRTGTVDSTKFLPIFADAVREAFSPGLPNAVRAFDAEVNRLTNNLQKMIVVFYDLGVADAFTNIIKELNRILSDKAIAEEFAIALKKIADNVTEFLKKIDAETVRKFIDGFTNALTTMSSIITGTVLPVIKELAKWIGTIASTWLILKGIGTGAAAGAMFGPKGALIGGAAGGIAAAGVVAKLNSMLEGAEEEDKMGGWTGSAGRMANRGLIQGVEPRLPDDLAAAWEGGLALAKNQNIALSRKLSDVVGKKDEKAKKIDMVGLSAGQLKENEMFEEARKLGHQFRITEAEEFRKFRQLDLQESDDYYSAGGAALLEYHQERIKLMIQQIDDEENLAYAKGEAIIAADRTSHSMKLLTLADMATQGMAAEQEAHRMRMEFIGQFTDAELEELGGRLAIEEQMERDHADRVHAIRLKSQAHILAAMQAYRDRDFKNATGTTAAITANLASHSRKWFEINKAASIANIALEGAQAVMAAYRWGTTWGGPAGGAAMAGIAAAFYASQAAIVAQTTYGGGGASGIPSQAGSPGLPVTPTPATDIGAGQASQTQIQIVIEGNVLGNQDFVDQILIPTLREAIDNRDVLIISPNSRQAAELG